MTNFYLSAQRRLQDEFESRKLADRLEQMIVRDQLDSKAQDFVRSSDFFFLSTVDEEGFPTVSYKGGEPGFVQIVDEDTLRFPCFDGNGMWLSAGNVAGTGKVGLLFVDFEDPRRLRVQGTARLRRDPEIVSRWPEVALAVEVQVTRTWVNCPRYIHKMSRVEDARHVPREGVETPTPGWKKAEGLSDVVPPAPHEVARRGGGRAAGRAE